MEAQRDQRTFRTRGWPTEQKIFANESPPRTREFVGRESISIDFEAKISRERRSRSPVRDLAQRTIRYQTRSPLRQDPSKREANQFPRVGYFWDFPHEVGRRQGERLSNRDRAFENEPTTPQTYTHVLGNGGREPRSGEVILIRMPFEQIMGRISLTTESEAASTGKGINKPTLHPVLISIVKNIKGPGEQNTIELIGLMVKSFSHTSDPVRWIAGKRREEKDLLLPMPSRNPAATPTD